MSRQRGDVHERDNGGSLFNPRLRTLSGTADPATSTQAAVRAIASGRVAGDALYLLDLVTEHPGWTMEEYGAHAALTQRTGNAFGWRIRLGRRTGTLKYKGLIHQRGERDGKGLWFPGPAPEAAR